MGYSLSKLANHTGSLNARDLRSSLITTGNISGSGRQSVQNTNFVGGKMKTAFKTKNEVVYESLRKEILEGKLKPGQRVLMSDLTKKFGFSGIPIREAIRKLESEELLVGTPHVGTSVSKIDPDEIIEFYLMRIELESLSARLAVPHLDISELGHLEKILEKTEKAVGENDFEMLGKLNKEFHLRIYHAAPYPNLYKFVVELWEKVHRIKSVFVIAPERGEKSLKEHREILKAIRKQDAKLTAKLIRRQKENSLEAMSNYFRKNKLLNK